MSSPTYFPVIASTQLGSLGFPHGWLAFLYVTIHIHEDIHLS